MDITRFLQYLEYERRCSEHTRRAYQTDLRQFFDWLQETYGESDPAAVTPLQVRSWMVSLMDRGLRPRSVNRKLSSLKSFFRFELRHGRIKSDPMQQVTAPKPGRRLPVVVREEQLQRLFQQMEFSEDFAGLRDRLLLEMLYGTGMRRSELIGLRDEQIDLRQQRLRVFGKGGKERFIPLLPGLAELITAYRNLRSETFGKLTGVSFFRTDRGEPLYPNFVYRKVKHYLEQVATAERLSPHVLRHSFATHLTDHGAEINAVKELLGHASLAATQIYTHNSPERLKGVYDKAHPKSGRKDDD